MNSTLEPQCRIEQVSANNCGESSFLLYSEADRYRYGHNIDSRIISPKRLSSFHTMIMDLRRNLLGDGMGVKTKQTKTYFTQEICCLKIDNTIEIAVATAVTTPNGTVTVAIKGKYDSNGTHSLPIEGHDVLFQQNGMFTWARITAVDKTTPFAHAITLKGLGGKPLDLTAAGNGGVNAIKLVYNHAKEFNFGNCSKADPQLIQTQPKLIKHSMVMGHKKICKSVEQLSAMGYTKVPIMNGVKGMPVFDYMDADGQVVKSEYNWESPMKSEIEMTKTMDMLWHDLFGVNYNDGKSYDGIITAAKRNVIVKGNFADVPFFTAQLDRLAAKLHENNYSGTYCIFYDYEMSNAVNKSLRQIVKDETPYHFPLFSGDKDGVLKWGKFKKIEDYNGTGIDFVFKQIDTVGITDIKKLIKNYAFGMPLMGYKDQYGNDVMPIEFTKPEVWGDWQDNTIMLYDNRKNEACAQPEMVGRWSHGLEIHCPENLFFWDGDYKNC